MTKWYIKEFSLMTGISMRSLRHYDQMGLLTPSLRLKTGYRLYSSMDLARAQQVIALKSFGIELQDIKDILSDNVDLPDYFKNQITLLNEKIRGLQKASHILEQVTTELHQKKSISVSNIMKLIGIYTMSTTHFANYLKEKSKLNASQIESILSEHSNSAVAALTPQQIDEAQKMQLTGVLDDLKDITIETFIKKQQAEGLSDEETMKAVQEELLQRAEKLKKSGYTKDRMELLKQAGKYFNQKMALAMAHDYLATSLEVQSIIKEYLATVPATLELPHEALREYYKTMPENDALRAYLDDLSPGLIDFIAEGMLFFIDNKDK